MKPSHPLVAVFKRLATVEKKHYEKGISSGAGNEYVGMCKGMWLAYMDAAKRLQEKG